MNMKQITEQMREIAAQMKRGKYTIFEAEKAMTEKILDGVLEMPCETGEQNYRRIACSRKLKRRMWRILLDATK